MKLVYLIGNTAVGKMTVGQELCKLTELRLFHNHMTIEPVIELFGYYNHSAVDKMREICFREFAETDMYGMAFTFMWAFNMQEDWDYIAGVTELFESKGAEVYYVELCAPQEIRIQRNKTENRLKHKASKRDVEKSHELLLSADKKYRLESEPGEIKFKNYLRLDTSALSPRETAEIVQREFDL